MAAEILKKNGIPIGVNLEDDEEEIVEELDDTSFETAYCRKLDRDLEGLNQAIIDCAQHLKTGFEQKAEDIDHKLSKLPERVKLQEPTLSKIFEKNNDILTDLEDQDLGVQEMFGNLDETVQELSEAKPAISTIMRKEVPEEMKKPVEEDIGQLEKLRSGVMEMLTALEQF
jgi:sulfite reductase alpha subunit-like flavoprotein